MKRIAVIILMIIGIIVFANFNSRQNVSWPDFVKFENEFYIKKDNEIGLSEVDEKVGKVESNSPHNTCKWIPMDNEAGRLPVGTEIYGLKSNVQTGIVALCDGEYIYYDKITEDEFYSFVSKCNTR